MNQAVRNLIKVGTGLRILVTDDNSPYGTSDIADELAGRCSEARVSVVHRPGKEGLGGLT